VAAPIDSQPVVIVGGGVSGLAAAVRLTSSGIPVVLLEQRARTGGRAASFIDRITGDVVDNGQHLLIAGYDRTLALTETIGSHNLLRVQERPELLYHHPARGFVRFTLPRLAPPFNLAWGILTSSLFSFTERIAVLRAGIAMQRNADKRFSKEGEGTVAEWLKHTHQPASVQASFWGPLAVSIMNERVETAQAGTFLDALRIAFLGHWHHAALVFPQAGLSEIFGEPAVQFIEAHGGLVRCSTEVRALVVENGRVAAVRLADGSDIQCRAAVLAVPHTEAAALFPDPPGSPVEVVRMAGVPSAPVVSLHLWFREQFMEQDAVGLIGRTIHWVFRRANHVAVTISAAYDTVDLSREALVAIAVRELREVFGGDVGTPYHALAIREKAATLSLTPAAARSRPGVQTTLSNLFLAGDWTATGLPATIEGAIRSGEKAAGQAIRAC
jgi:squalene-associated FAD-dependent desaturase